MIVHRLGVINKNQKGFTLVELAVALAITGLITGGITMTIFQVFDVNARTSNHMTAVRQVQNAGYWISRDAQMAQSTVITEVLGFPSTLTWTEYVAPSDEHQVVYTLLADNKLQREHYTNRDINPDPNTTTFVAQYIDSDTTKTKCEFIDTDGDTIKDKLILIVTATVSGWPQEQSETRIYEVIPRPGS